MGVKEQEVGSPAMAAPAGMVPCPSTAARRTGMGPAGWPCVRASSLTTLAWMALQIQECQLALMKAKQSEEEKGGGAADARRWNGL